MSSGLGLTDLGVLDVLSLCRGTPGSPRLTKTSQSWDAKHSYAKQVEDSPDRPRTPSLRMKKYNLRAVLSLGLLTLVRLGTSQPAMRGGHWVRQPSTHRTLWCLFEASLSVYLTTLGETGSGLPDLPGKSSQSPWESRRKTSTGSESSRLSLIDKGKRIWAGQRSRWTCRAIGH